MASWNWNQIRVKSSKIMSVSRQSQVELGVKVKTKSVRIWFIPVRSESSWIQVGSTVFEINWRCSQLKSASTLVRVNTTRSQCDLESLLIFTPWAGIFEPYGTKLSSFLKYILRLEKYVNIPTCTVMFQVMFHSVSRDVPYISGVVS